MNRLVIVGAGPAGLAAARAYREHRGTAEVTLVGEEALVPYRRPPLTKEFVRGELPAEELVIESRGWFDQNRIELRLGWRASSIDPDTGNVTLVEANAGGHSTTDEALRADAIVLATGAEPLRPELPGMQDPRVHAIRELSHSQAIATDAKRGSHALVIGTGFIGCEIAASLAMKGVQVTLIGQEPAPQQGRLGPQAAGRIAGWLLDLGIELKLGLEVSAIEDARIVHLRAQGGARVQAQGGAPAQAQGVTRGQSQDRQAVEGDLVLLGMGMRPRVELAQDAGLEIVDGAILTDGQLRAHERVFAAGDVALAYNVTAGRRLHVEHWGDALGQGEVVGRVLAGQDLAWDEVPGFWSTIGRHTFKYAAWGDGYDSCEFVEHPDGGFTGWYSSRGELVGVLTHDRDQDYECGRRLIAARSRAAI